MRTALLFLVASALAAFSTMLAEATTIHLWSGAKKEAKYLESHDKAIKDGNYRLRSVSTGRYITFYAKGNNLQMYPKGKGGDMGKQSQIFRIRPHHYKSYHGLQSIHHFNKHNEKCLSAAWGSVSDKFAPMYACRIDLIKGKSDGHITSPNGVVPDDKQIWLFIPGSTKNSYRIVTLAHLLDFKPRCLYPKHLEGKGAMGYTKGLALNECPGGKDKHYEWILEKA